MTGPDDRIRAELQRLARELDERAPAIGPDEVRSRNSPGGTRRRLVVAAAAVLVAVAAGAWALAGGDDEQTTVVGPGPTADRSTPSTPSAEPTTSTTQLPWSGADWFDWEALPQEGVAVLGLDGTLTLHDLVGDVMAAGPLPLSTNAAELWVQPGTIQAASAGMAEVPPGCASAAVAGGTRVARCGDDPEQPQRIDLVDVTGTAATVLGTPPWHDGGADPALGHWRHALPSPDGRWVLAEWSGECEVPEAALVDVATGETRPVAEPVAGLHPSSRALGWTSDGRAVVELPESPCGSTAAEPGVHLLDTGTGALDRVLDPPEQGSQVFRWSKQTFANAAERLVMAAIDQLGLEGCCGEPSHGGLDVTMGAVYEGDDIGFAGSPTERVEELPVEGRVPLLHGEAAVARGFEGMRIVQFRCGGFTWSLSWWGEEPAEVDSMVLLGEELVPHLGCTLGEPPG